MIALASRHPDLKAFAAKSLLPQRGTKLCKMQHIPWRKALGFWDILATLFWWCSALAFMIVGVYEWEHVGSQMSVKDRYNRFGLGNVDPTTTIDLSGGQFPYSAFNNFPVLCMIANSPQLWLSIGYLLWNNQITRIWMEREWLSRSISR